MEYSDLEQQQLEYGVKWDNYIRSAIAGIDSTQMRILEHDRQHGTAEDCMSILNELGLDINNISPIITQIGTIKFDGVRRPVMVSHMGLEYLRPIKQKIGILFGSTAKLGKEFMRIEDKSEVQRLLDVPYGVSSPIVDRATFTKFHRVAIVLDQTEVANTVAIAATPNSTMLLNINAYCQMVKGWMSNMQGSGVENVHLLEYTGEG
jgi:hypothetical protein